MYIYVVCDGSTPLDFQCITNEISGNQNLQNCTAQQTSGGSFDVQTFCGLCLGDFRTIYDTCGVSPNLIEASEFILFISLSI